MKKTKKTPLLFLLALSLILSFSGCEKTGGGKEEPTSKVPVESTEETTEEVWTPHFVKPKYGNFCLVYKGEVLDPQMTGMEYFFERSPYGYSEWEKNPWNKYEYDVPVGHGSIVYEKGTNYTFKCESGLGTPIEDLYINGILPIDCTMNEFEEAVGLPITDDVDRKLNLLLTQDHYYDIDETTPYYYYPDGVYYCTAFFSTETGKMISIETHFIPKGSFERYGVMAFPEE